MQVSWLLDCAAAEPLHAPAAWSWLEAAHILGQSHFGLHSRVHTRMLSRAWAEQRWLEVWSQVLRLALTPVGHLFNRLPLGNPGSGRVGALTPMPVPEHLAELIAQSRAVCTVNE